MVIRRYGLALFALPVLWLAASTMNAQTLTTTFAGGNGNAGNMFDAVAGPSDLWVQGMDLHIGTTQQVFWEVYTKTGTFAGSETNMAAWTLANNGVVTGGGVGNPVFVGFTNAIQLSLGTTTGFWVTLTSPDIAYTDIGAGGAQATYNNADLTLNLGVGLPYPIGAGFNASRAWNGTVYYSLSNPIGDPEINVTYGGSNRLSGQTEDIGPNVVNQQFTETWTIENTATTNNLTITAVMASPSGVQNCFVTAQPVTPSASIAPSSSSTFDVDITVIAEGPFEFTISISNNDTTGNEAPFELIVQGSGGMDGTYLVSNDTAESPDFTDIGAAFDQLELAGVAGPVTISVSEGTGPYTGGGTYSLGATAAGLKAEVKGTSSTNSITVINEAGERPVLQPGIGVVDPFVLGTGTLLIVETSFVTIEGLEIDGGNDFGLGAFDNLGTPGGMTDLTFRNNIVHGTTGNGIWIFSNLGMGVYNVTIENNFVYDVAIGNSGYWLAGGTAAPTLAGLGAIAFGPLGTNTVVRHNTVVVNSGQPSTGPATNHGAISVGADSGDGVAGNGPAFAELSYNIIVSTSTGIVPLDIPATSVPASADYNVYHSPLSPFTRINNVGGAANEDFNSWQFTSSQDANSTTVDPDLVDISVGSEDLHLTGSSVAIDLAQGSPVTTDIDGDARPQSTDPDAGADEFTGVINPPGAIDIPASPSLPNAVEQISYSTQITATQNTTTPPYSWSLGAGAPAWLTVSGTGLTPTLSGNPPIGAAGTFNFDITVNDSGPGPATDTETATLVVDPAGTLTITTGSLPAGTRDTAYPSTTLSVSGGTAPYMWSATGLPAGLTISTGGVISGTPTQDGSFTVMVTVTDGAAGSANRTYMLTINSPGSTGVGSNGGGGGGGGCIVASNTAPWLFILGLLGLFALGMRLRTREQ